jgi:hypothetical protein
MQKLLSTPGASKHTGVGVRKLARLRKRGDGPPYLIIDGMPYYDPDELDAWVASCRRVSRPEPQTVGQASEGDAR